MSHGHDKSLPPSLRVWAERVVGPLPAVLDASHPRETSRVWDVTDSRGRRFFIKQSASAALYERETFGYQSAVPALGFGRAPRLVETDPRQLALLLTAVPGTPVSRLVLSGPEHRSAHRQFGALLRRLHGTDKMPGAGRREARTALERLADDAEHHLTRAGDLMSEGRRALVRRSADHVRKLTDLLAPAHIHGDAQERNVLWTGPAVPGQRASTREASGQLAVIDFERSRYAPAVQDFVRLACGPWQDRDDLRDAFFHGYGRPLTDAERQALPCLAALDAASCLAYGPDHGEHDVTARGLRTLARLESGALGAFV
ncbi:phosphotransferase enzyme family protein [Streptomyces sp. 35G-GA-8]|uniref:phosphotransferase enzyme family protein n=1 Tax=Streptomyces sp. 35G-GA-8 TaxID=2939434 RepID=UPI00201ED2BF|nr:phosphotransferase [Streptomyces sp. 35G-GA-8]MCL7377510.1 phosphotransferase [Streptomyces sp. 35G-GA-8]